MNPEDVPDQMVVTARDAANQAPQKRDGKPTRMRHALAAVWPEIEKRVREQVAAEIEAERSGGTEHWHIAMDHAARIARGEAR